MRLAMLRQRLVESKVEDQSLDIPDAILERDAKRISELILAAEFVLLNTVVGEDEDDSNVGAMTAEIEDMEVLVVFSEENSAGEFVRENGDLFEEDEEVEGVVVEGIPFPTPAPRAEYEAELAAARAEAERHPGERGRGLPLPLDAHPDLRCGSTGSS